MYGVLANAVVLLHLGFVLFVVLGGFLVLRWPWLVWLHLPAAAWGALIEFAGWVCPLTPLELWLRRAAGEVGYTGGFIEHYLLPLLYPAALTREVQIVLGLGVLAVNLVAYALVWRKWMGE
ncbi:MAG: DUF2784 domain-containing protein [Gammaproteobacteria bacterium]